MAQVNFRVDDKIKAKAESVCAAMGLTMSTAINIFLTKLANERRIPFEVSVDPFYSDSNIRYLERKKREIDEGRAHFAEHDLIEVDD